MLDGGPAILGVVAAAVVSGRPFDDPTALKDADVAGRDVDDPRAEEAKEYSRKMGKWRRDTLEVSTSPMWWDVIDVVHRSHAPIDRHLRFLQKVVSEDVLADKGSRLASLVCGGATDIFNDFNVMLADRRWA